MERIKLKFDCGMGYVSEHTMYFYVNIAGEQNHTFDHIHIRITSSENWVDYQTGAQCVVKIDKLKFPLHTAECLCMYVWCGTFWIETSSMFLCAGFSQHGYLFGLGIDTSNSLWRRCKQWTFIMFQLNEMKCVL